MISDEVKSISPMPTSGETIPPKRKPIAPQMAEAAPMAVRPSSIARVVPAGNMNPVKKRRVNVSPSYTQKLSISGMRKSESKDIIVMPAALKSAAVFILRNLRVNAEAMAIPVALVAKTIEKKNSEWPK